MTTTDTTGRDVLTRLLSSLSRREKQAFHQGNHDQLRLILILKGFVYELLGSVSEELLDQPTLKLLKQLVRESTKQPEPTQAISTSKTKRTPRTRFSPKKVTLSSKHLIVARSFFFNEYSSIEELLQKTWGKEFDKTDKKPLAMRGLKNKFYTLMRKALVIITANLDNPDTLERLDPTQQEFYQKLLERFGTDSTSEKVTQFYEEKRKQLLGGAHRNHSTNGDYPSQRVGYNLHPAELVVLRLIFLEEVDISVNLVAERAERSSAWFYLNRDRIIAQVANVFASWEEEKKPLNLDNHRFYADLRIKYDGPVDLAQLQTVLAKRLPKGKRTSYAGKPIREKPAKQPRVPRQPRATVISREIVPSPDGNGTVEKVVLSPTAPPAPARPPDPPSGDLERGLHQSQYNLGENGRRIIRAIFLENHPSLLQVFIHLYSKEAPTESQALIHWREFFQRVDQPRRRFLAVMRSVYVDNSLVNNFPLAEQATVREILAAYPNHRDLENHSNSVNRPKASSGIATQQQGVVRPDPVAPIPVAPTPRPTPLPHPTPATATVTAEPPAVVPNKSRPQAPYSIPELELELLRAVLVQVGDEKPSLNLKLIEHRNRHGLVAEELAPLLKVAFQHLRFAYQAALESQPLEENTETLLLNLQFIFFKGSSVQEDAVREIIDQVIRLDQATGKSSSDVS